MIRPSIHASSPSSSKGSSGRTPSGRKTAKIEFTARANCGTAGFQPTASSVPNHKKSLFETRNIRCSTSSLSKSGWRSRICQPKKVSNTFPKSWTSFQTPLRKTNGLKNDTGRRPPFRLNSPAPHDAIIAILNFILAETM
jgi:hypothetical protein